MRVPAQPPGPDVRTTGSASGRRRVGSTRRAHYHRPADKRPTIVTRKRCLALPRQRNVRLARAPGSRDSRFTDLGVREAADGGPETPVTDNQAVQAYTDAWTQSIEGHIGIGRTAARRRVEPAPPSARAGRSGTSSRTSSRVESELLGDPRPIHSLPRDLRHVKDELSRYLELPVDERRCHTAPEMTGELDYTIIRRSRALRNEPGSRTTKVRWPGGPFYFDRPTTSCCGCGCFDVWVHEQDLRRALGTPGNLASPGAVVDPRPLVAGLPKVVAKMRRRPGRHHRRLRRARARWSSCAPSGSTRTGSGSVDGQSPSAPRARSRWTGRRTSAWPAAASARPRSRTASRSRATSCWRRRSCPTSR